MRSDAMARFRARRCRPVVALAAVVLLAALAAACQGSSADSDERPIVTPSAGDIIPILASSELAVGENRFVLGLQDRDKNLIVDALVHLRFFKLKDGEATLKVEAETLPITVEMSETSFVHEHQDGTSHVHGGDKVGVYVAYPEFDEPGLWGVEVNVTDEGGEQESARVQFDVLEEGSTPVVGAPAPRSGQRTLQDVDDISEIDSSIPPRPEMHELTIAEAIDSGQPTVVAFATPAFCESRVCGPMMDAVVDPLFERYGDRVAFTHVEPYILEKAHQGELIAITTMEEWGLYTEPWLFIIDREGRVAGKFEAIAALEEVEPVLERVLEESAVR